MRVVNQPFLFGWHEGRLYLQAYTVFEDDTRNWSKAPKTQLMKSMTPQLQKLIKDSQHRDRLGRRGAGDQGARVALAVPVSVAVLALIDGRSVVRRCASGAEPHTRKGAQLCRSACATYQCRPSFPGG